MITTMMATMITGMVRTTMAVITIPDTKVSMAER